MCWSSLVAQWVKDPALSPLWLGSLLWHWFHTWPRNFPCAMGMAKKQTCVRRTGRANICVIWDSFLSQLFICKLLGLWRLAKVTQLKERANFFVCLFRAIPSGYGGSQARDSNRNCSCRPTPEPQQPGIRAVSSTYTTAHGNAGSLTH